MTEDELLASYSSIDLHETLERIAVALERLAVALDETQSRISCPRRPQNEIEARLAYEAGWTGVYLPSEPEYDPPDGGAT